MVYHTATIRQPKINHYTTYQDFNNKNISIIKTMYTKLFNNKAGTMNATDYRAYREEQALRKEIERQETPKAPSYTFRFTNNITNNQNMPKASENNRIRAILSSYRKLNNQYLELKEIIEHYNPTAKISTYGRTSTHTNKKHDLSDELVKIEGTGIEFANIVLMRSYIKGRLQDITALPYSDIRYIINTYIDEITSVSTSKTSRIIKEILKKSIELPTVEQAKLYIKS